jgi:1,4-dihydroxy-2-naphthoate octaprenyltransferase
MRGRNLIVRLGLKKAGGVYVLFPTLVFTMILSGIAMHLIPLPAVATLIALPLCWNTALSLRHTNLQQPSKLMPAMAQNVLAARIVGIILTVSYVLVRT